MMLKYEWNCIKCAHCCIYNDVSLDELDLWSIYHKTASEVLFSEKRVTSVSTDEDFGFQVPNAIAVPYFFMNKLSTDPCPFLTHSHCNIYELRPVGCRAYPFLLSPDDFQFDPECKSSTESHDWNHLEIFVSNVMVKDLAHYYLRVTLLDFLIETMHQKWPIKFFTAQNRGKLDSSCIGILEFLISQHHSLITLSDIMSLIHIWEQKALSTLPKSTNDTQKVSLKLLYNNMCLIQSDFLSAVKEKLFNE